MIVSTNERLENGTMSRRDDTSLAWRMQYSMQLRLTNHKKSMNKSNRFAANNAIANCKTKLVMELTSVKFGISFVWQLLESAQGSCLMPITATQFYGWQCDFFTFSNFRRLFQKSSRRDRTSEETILVNLCFFLFKIYDAMKKRWPTEKIESKCVCTVISDKILYWKMGERSDTSTAVCASWSLEQNASIEFPFRFYICTCVAIFVRAHNSRSGI